MMLSMVFFASVASLLNNVAGVKTSAQSLSLLASVETSAQSSSLLAGVETSAQSSSLLASVEPSAQSSSLLASVEPSAQSSSLLASVEPSAQSSSPFIRKNINILSLEEADDLRRALRRMQNDTGPTGYEYIAGFHGAPFRCTVNGEKQQACGAHGKYAFPYWHRLMVVQIEQCLKEHGLRTGIPYWDFTMPGPELPQFLTDTTDDNPFSSYTIRYLGKKTIREPTEALFDSNNAEGTCLVYQLVLIILQQENYCLFENFLESLHNALHSMLGGRKNTYSLFSAAFAAYDPMFMVLHSSLDRIWVLWQKLQKHRGLPYKVDECGGKSIHEVLHPFDNQEMNVIALTRENSYSGFISDHLHLQYDYDTVEIHNHDVPELDKIIRRRQNETRVYVGRADFNGQPVRTETFVLNDAGEQFLAGTNFLMGNSEYTSWLNGHWIEFDITNAVRQAGVPLDKNIKFHFRVETYNRSFVADVTDYAIFYVREAYADYEIINIPIGVSYELPAQIRVPKNTRIRFLPVSKKFEAPIVDMVNDTNFQNCTLPQPSFDSYAVNVMHSVKPGDYYFASSNKEACDGGKKIIVQVHW